jgi:hypothetical protein
MVSSPASVTLRGDSPSQPENPGNCLRFPQILQRIETRIHALSRGKGATVHHYCSASSTSRYCSRLGEGDLRTLFLQGQRDNQGKGLVGD